MGLGKRLSPHFKHALVGGMRVARDPVGGVVDGIHRPAPVILGPEGGQQHALAPAVIIVPTDQVGE